MASQSVPNCGVVAEQTPLRTAFVRSHSRFVLRWPNEYALEIKYHRIVRAVAWVFCILGWPVVLLGVLALIGVFMEPEAMGFVAAGGLLIWGGAMGLMGVWLLGPRYRFNTMDGCLTVRHFWRTRRRPLVQIKAVQIVDAGWFGTKFNEGLNRDRTVKFRSYQLNLVVDDPQEPRVFVTYNHDLTDMARKAKILADFLSVPLLAEASVQAIAQAYETEDAQLSSKMANVRRFRGTDTLTPVLDQRLPEPYITWIDEGQPLPAKVQIFPRTVSILQDLSQFIVIGVLIIGMDALIAALFLPVLVAAGGRLTVAVVGGVCLLLALIPLYLLRRLIITLGAWRRRQRGTLRQGILIGTDGVLVRMEPNRCYTIALDRFVNATIEKSATASNVPSDFVIETRDGRVTFFLDASSITPDQLNQCVANLQADLPSRPS